MKSGASIGVQVLTYVTLLANFVANYFLLRFSATRKLKQVNKNSRRISKIILKYLATTNLLQVIFSITSTTTTVIRQHRSSDDMIVFRRISIAVSEAFYIVVTEHICLLLYHRYNHMISQSLGKEPKIKKHKLKTYIAQLYGVALVSLTLSVLPLLFNFNKSVYLAMKILSTFFTNVPIMLIFYFLFFSISGIRSEILNRYQGYNLTFKTLNGQYSYCIIVFLYFILVILKEVFLKIEYIMVSQLLWQLFFLLQPIAYCCNDRNFRSYVISHSLRPVKITPIAVSKKRRQSGRTKIPYLNDTLTLCDGCRLPQPKPKPKPNPNTAESSKNTQFLCTTCKCKEDEESNSENNNDNVSIISQIEALDLQRRQISTPVKLLITSAFHIKAAHQICAREFVVGNHWKKVSLKRSNSQAQVPLNYEENNQAKRRSQSENTMSSNYKRKRKTLSEKPS